MEKLFDNANHSNTRGEPPAVTGPPRKLAASGTQTFDIQSDGRFISIRIYVTTFLPQEASETRRDHSTRPPALDEASLW
jgi:hypothetical protein